MKHINTYILSKIKKEANITEKLKISNKKIKHTLFPKDKWELANMVDLEIKNHGNKCSLNHIDVSSLTDLSFVFARSPFNGDISEWDVSNVEDMYFMFNSSEFNGDISEWDVSNVTDMQSMFEYSKFNQDISEWEINPKCKFKDMFYECNILPEFKPKAMR